MKNKPKYRVKKGYLLLFCLFAYVAICFGQQFYRINHIDKEIADYLQVKKQLLEEQELLKGEIALLQNKSYIERIAREDLGMIKPGETLLVPGEPGNMPEVKAVGDVSDNIH